MSTSPTQNATSPLTSKSAPELFALVARYSCSACAQPARDELRRRGLDPYDLDEPIRIAGRKWKGGAR